MCTTLALSWFLFTGSCHFENVCHVICSGREHMFQDVWNRFHFLSYSVSECSRIIRIDMWERLGTPWKLVGWNKLIVDTLNCIFGVCCPWQFNLVVGHTRFTRKFFGRSWCWMTTSSLSWSQNGHCRHVACWWDVDELRADGAAENNGMQTIPVSRLRR